MISSVKLKISSFGIEEWIVLVHGNNKPLRYLLDSYILIHPITSAKGLAYTEFGGYLKSLKYNDGSSLTILNESPSRRIGNGYVTIFWRYFIMRLTGAYAGRLPRGGVPMDEIIKFKAGDTLSLELNTVFSTVPI